MEHWMWWLLSDYRILLEKFLVSDKENIFRVQNEKVISLIQIMFIEEKKITLNQIISLIIENENVITLN